MIRGRIITDDKDTSGIEILEEDFLESFALDFSLMGIPYVTLTLPIKSIAFSDVHAWSILNIKKHSLEC